MANRPRSSSEYTWVVFVAEGPTSSPDRLDVHVTSELAAERPLLCLVGDEQWLDQASAQALTFVARRLEAGSVGMVFASRIRSSELSGLPELSVKGLAESDARALLESVLTRLISGFVIRSSQRLRETLWPWSSCRVV